MRPQNEDSVKAIRECIQNNMSRDCVCLTVRLVAEKSGVPFQTVGRHIQRMIDNGEVRQDSEYGYVMAGNAGKINRYRAVPVVGTISCGSLNIAEPDVTEYMKLPEGMISDGEYFLLRAHGESMINAGIDSGDLVLIRKQNTADSGQIAVVISTEFSDAGGTLKRYYPEPKKHRIRLHPGNDTMKDFYIREGIVQGVATKVIKVRSLI